MISRAGITTSATCSELRALSGPYATGPSSARQTMPTWMPTDRASGETYPIRTAIRK